MISIETMKFRTAEMIGDDLPLVFWRGKGSIVGSDERALALLVRGVRCDYTWDRLTTTWKRLLANHTLSVDELGGAAELVDRKGVVREEPLPGRGEAIPAVVAAHAAHEQRQGALVGADDTALAAPEHERQIIADHLGGAELHRLNRDHDPSEDALQALLYRARALLSSALRLDVDDHVGDLPVRDAQRSLDLVRDGVAFFNGGAGRDLHVQVHINVRLRPTGADGVATGHARHGAGHGGRSRRRG